MTRRAKQPGTQTAVQTSVTALVAAAAGGRRDLAWLDKAIRRAGYLKADEALSKADVRRAAAAMAEAFVDAETTAESPCCKACLHRALDALTALVGGK